VLVITNPIMCQFYCIEKDARKRVGCSTVRKEGMWKLMKYFLEHEGWKTVTFEPCDKFVINEEKVKDVKEVS